MRQLSAGDGARFFHMNKKVKNYAVHQAFEMDLQNVWLDA